METAERAVDALFHYRDHYLETQGLEKAAEKYKDVKLELDNVLKILESLQGDITNKSEYLMLKGKALNVMPNFDKEAEELLSKSVKLGPSLVEAWIHLGETYWKKGDVQAAKNCFVGALNHRRSAVVLRNLSMVLRRLPGEQQVSQTEESVEKAREAVQLDISDGTSWLVLGNAYLSLFFITTQSPKILKQCLGAYQQAEKDPVAMNNPDLHFNRASVYRYQGDYEMALKDFNMTCILDPIWDEAQECMSRLVKYLTDVQDLIRSLGKLKVKRVQGLQEAIRDADLGPFGGGSYTSPHGKTVSLKNINLQDLIPEENLEKVIVGRVLFSVNNPDLIPYTFGLLDKCGTCYAVAVYNVASSYGLSIGDSVALPEPFLQSTDFTFKDQNFQFSSIRVDTPVVMAVNGRKLGIDKQAPTTLAVSMLSD